MDTKQQAPTVVLSARVRPEQREMVRHFWQDSGCLSLSEAVRRILDEWDTLTTPRADCDALAESARAEGGDA